MTKTVDSPIDAHSGDEVLEAMREFVAGDPCYCVRAWQHHAVRSLERQQWDSGGFELAITALLQRGAGRECRGVAAALEAVGRSGLEAQRWSLDEYRSCLNELWLRVRDNAAGCTDPRKTSAERIEADMARRVRDEADRLRVRIAAEDLVADERAAEQFRNPEPVGIGTFLSDEPDEPSHHFEGLWPYGGIVLAQAPKKWGKSTLVRNVVRSGVTGQPFLGKFHVTALFQRVLLIDMELTRRQLWDYWVGIGLTDDQVEVWRLRGSSSTMAIKSQYVRREITRRMRDAGADLVVLDPLGPALRACGFAENSNDDVGRFLDLFDEMRTDADIAAALIPHHMGHTSEHGRGASVLGDKADAIWTGTFTKPGQTSGVRFLGATGRDVDFDSTELAYDPDTRALAIDDNCRTRASIVKETKEERHAREREERSNVVRLSLAERPAGFKSNAELTRHLGVTWNGAVLADIKRLLVADGTLKTGGGWFPNHRN